VQTLLRARAGVRDLRHGALEQVVVTDQQFVYRRGAAMVALNNDTTAATVTLPAPVMGRDVLGACGVPSGRALTIPARRSCVFVPGR